jgi:hypothetical protein
MRTGRLLELFRDRRPLVVAAKKPSLVAHGTTPCPHENPDFTWMGGVKAGYDFFILRAGCGVSSGRGGFAEFPV